MTLIAAPGDHRGTERSLCELGEQCWKVVTCVSLYGYSNTPAVLYTLERPMKVKVPVPMGVEATDAI